MLSFTVLNKRNYCIIGWDKNTGKYEKIAHLCLYIRFYLFFSSFQDKFYGFALTPLKLLKIQWLLYIFDLFYTLTNWTHLKIFLSIFLTGSSQIHPNNKLSDFLSRWESLFLCTLHGLTERYNQKITQGKKSKQLIDETENNLQ